LDGGVRVKPNVWQARAGPRRRGVGEAVGIGGITVLVPDQRRVDVAVAAFDAVEVVAPALLAVGYAGELGAGLCALRGVVGDVGPPHRPPDPPAGCGLAGRLDVAQPDRPALLLVGREQARSAPALQGGCAL